VLLHGVALRLEYRALQVEVAERMIGHDHRAGLAHVSIL
jgi:hypothetical protein